jgi:hypothetical protein
MSDLYRPELNHELLRWASTKPVIQSLLYDLDLLPEQLLAQKEMTVGLFAAYNRLEGVLIAFKAMEIEKGPRRNHEK